MTADLQARLNTWLLAFISIMVTAFATLWWALFGNLPADVQRIREDISVIKNQQGAIAQLHDARMQRIEKDVERLERSLR